MIVRAMLDFATLTREQRANVDIGDKVETYRGFLRAVRYVVMVRIAIAIPAAMVFFDGAPLSAAIVVGVILLALGFYALPKASKVIPKEVAAASGRFGTAPR